MIRIHRGPEPPGLALTRRNRLALAMDAYASHGGGSRELTATLVEYGSRATAVYNALAYYVPPATRITHGLLDPPRPGATPTT